MKNSPPKPRESRPANRTGDPALGTNLRAIRERKKLSQERLAADVGVTKGLLSQFENGITMPSLPVLVRVANRLDVTTDAIIHGPGRAPLSTQPVLPGHSLDDRIAALPEGLREFVLLSLKRAEKAARHIPEQFLVPPTSDNWQKFADYLEAISTINNGGDDR